jgi:hypothetical protein
MRRYLTVLTFALLSLGIFFGARQLILGQGRGVRILPVPGGDQEVAWIHTSTNVSNWERFVTGIHRIPKITVDDSGAFPEKTTVVPEVVLTLPDCPQKIRVRWYKLTSEISTSQIVGALAERDPPPLALVGGGSTDRALDLAKALSQRQDWRGSRPLLLLTTATANDVLLDDEPTANGSVAGFRKPRDLMKVYEGFTYRFCFTNQQMANAVVDFLWHQPELKPNGTPDQPTPVFVLAWDDDPYSLDLSEHFRKRLHSSGQPIRLVKDIVHFSVGTFDRPNRKESEFAEQILQDLADQPGARSLLVLPTVGPPARRILKTLAGEHPLIGKNLVAVNGDGIPFNLFYRDAEIAWPIRDLPIPFVFFMHQNPVAWDQSPASPAPMGTLLPPNSTEDVLLYSELMDRVCRSASVDGTLVPDSISLAERMRKLTPDYFEEDGDRKPGSGEYIVWVRPKFLPDNRIGSHSSIEVWTREGKSWRAVRTLEK